MTHKAYKSMTYDAYKSMTYKAYKSMTYKAYKLKLSSSFWQHVLLSWGITLSPYTVSIDGIRKIIWECTRVHLIIEVVIFIPSGPLNSIQSNIMNDLLNWLVFLRQSSFNVSFEWHQTKVPASTSWSVQILDSLPIITFIQLSTHYDNFCSAHFTLVLFVC